MSPLITPRHITLRIILFYGMVICVVAMFIVYVLFQARFMIAGPQISISNEPSHVQTSRIVTIEGSARNIVRMSLNGRQIYTDKYGNFKEALILENGYTVATLKAEDRYGRKTSLAQKFVYHAEDTVSINY